MGDKYLADVINYERDIKPYQIITIYSGVGSGKSKWVGTLVDAGYNILMFTSRSITANNQSAEFHADRWIKLDHLCALEKTDGQRLVLSTNSSIEKYLKDTYDKENELTHIGRLFDIIILDEAHSLTTDASFSDPPFHIMKFLKDVQKNYPSCKIIFMTGTPEPIEWAFSQSTVSSPLFNNIDCYDECKHVDPQNVILYPFYNASQELCDQLIKYPEEQIIYYAHSVERIKNIILELTKKGISENEIGIAFSRKDKEPLFSKSMLKQKEKLKSYIEQYEALPLNIRVYITTTQTKEGINILNDNIKLMFAENCRKADLIQMAGRVRKGLDDLIIVYGYPQHQDSQGEYVIKINRKCVQSVNKAYEEFIEENDLEAKDAVEIRHYIEKTFPYIRYNYFDEEFQFYGGKARDYEQSKEDRDFITWCINHWGDYCSLSNEKQAGEGAIAFGSWFPYSDCRDLYVKKSKEVLQEELQKGVDTLLQNNNYLLSQITKEKRDECLRELNQKVFDGNTEQYFKTLNPLLKKFGYKIYEVGKHNSSNFQIVKMDIERE